MCGNGVRAGMTLIRIHGFCGAGPGAITIQRIFAARTAAAITRGTATSGSGFVVPRTPANPVPFFLFPFLLCRVGIAHLSKYLAGDARPSVPDMGCISYVETYVTEVMEPTVAEPQGVTVRPS